MGVRGARDPRRRVPDYLAQRARWTLSGFGHECLSQNDRNLRDIEFAGLCSSVGVGGRSADMAPKIPAIRAGQKPETMTPRLRILASGALGCHREVGLQVPWAIIDAVDRMTA